MASIPISTLKLTHSSSLLRRKYTHPSVPSGFLSPLSDRYFNECLRAMQPCHFGNRCQSQQGLGAFFLILWRQPASIHWQPRCCTLAPGSPARPCPWPPCHIPRRRQIPPPPQIERDRQTSGSGIHERHIISPNFVLAVPSPTSLPHFTDNKIVFELNIGQLHASEYYSAVADDPN